VLTMPAMVSDDEPEGRRSGTVYLAFAASALGVHLVGGDVRAGTNSVPVPFTLAKPGEIGRRWRAAKSPAPVLERGQVDGSPFLTVHEDPALGFRIRATGYGDHLVPSSGEWLLSELPPGSPWRRERLMVAQVLPLLATLHGLEILHAGAVVLDDVAIGIVARSGIGKSSTIAQLVARGADFLADDVLGLEACGGSLLRAHPGPPLLNLDPAQYRTIPASGRDRLGPLVGRSEKLHLSPSTVDRPVPLGALFFLDRLWQAPPEVLRPAVGGARQVLGNAYLSYATSPRRLVRQLQIAAGLSEHVPLLHLRAGPEEDPASIAARIENHVSRG